MAAGAASFGPVKMKIDAEASYKLKSRRAVEAEYADLEAQRDQARREVARADSAKTILLVISALILVAVVAFIYGVGPSA